MKSGNNFLIIRASYPVWAPIAPIAATSAAAVPTTTYADLNPIIIPSPTAALATNAPISAEKATTPPVIRRAFPIY